MANQYPSDLLDSLTVEGHFYENIEDGSVRCFACAHRCHIQPGKRGICQVRYNREGKLRVPWGYVAGLQTDPIEKKPFAHFLPGSDVLTFGMLGCDFHCAFCQNWKTSQTLRDPAAASGASSLRRMTPDQLISSAKRSGASIIASSYNEPLITSEWATAIFSQAHQAGMRCAYVSNGNATPEVLRFIRPFLTALKIDLKSMKERSYNNMGGKLQSVLDTIRLAHELGIWIEVVTLIIPNFNDSVQELWDASHFLASISPDIPWHVTAYHPDYHMNNLATTASILRQAAEIGQEAGLHYVYAGNLPGKVGSLEDTYCPNCHFCLIHRQGYLLLEYKITAQGTCPRCGTSIAGVWSHEPRSVRIGRSEKPVDIFW
jgi:pyruvate formate lyase activating enzyme